MPLAPKIT